MVQGDLIMNDDKGKIFIINIMFLVLHKYIYIYIYYFCYKIIIKYILIFWKLF